MTDKERFISIYKEKIHREGSAALLDYLCDKCDCRRRASIYARAWHIRPR